MAPFPVPGPVHTPRLLRRDCGTQGLSHVPSSCCPLFLRAPPTPLPLFSHFSPYLCDQPPGFCSWFVSTADLKRLPHARGRQQLYQDESLSCTEIQESLALSSTPTNKHIQATFAWVQLLRSPRLLYRLAPRRGSCSRPSPSGRGTLQSSLCRTLLFVQLRHQSPQGETTHRRLRL